MREFYSVHICFSGDDNYFRDKSHAKQFLWQYFLDNCLTGYETDEDFHEVREELNEFDSITNVGTIYTECFED